MTSTDFNSSSDTEKARELIPVSHFFGNPEKSRFSLSPDGNHIAFLAPWKNRMNLHVSNAEKLSESKRISSAEDRDILNYLWADSNYLLFLQDSGGDENYHLFRSDISSGITVDMTPFDGVKVDVVDERYKDPETVYIQMNKRDSELFDLYELHFKSGKLNMIAQNPGNVSTWIPDHDGAVRAAITTDGVDTSLLYRKDSNSEFRTVLTTNFRDSLQPQMFSFDNKYLLALSNLNRNTLAAVKIDPETGKEMEVFYENQNYDCSGIGVSLKREVITSIRYTDWKLQREIVDDVTDSWFSSLQKHLGEYAIQIESTTREEHQLICRAYSDRQPGSYYLYDINEDKLTHITDIKPQINPDLLCEMKPISFTARDGLKIHGYLTLPRQYKSGAVPVVVNPHGGPWYRDEWGYNPETQFLANRGMAVLKINFRGSTGYGKKFLEASFGEWGLKMQDDVSDGVRWIIDQGIADEKKIGIYGASYGGYCTLAGLTFTPELYCCGVDYVGVSNLFTFMETIPPYWKPYLNMMYEMVGHPEKDKKRLHATSPVFHADRIKVPLFVAQGARDPRVVKSESDQIVKALKDAGVAVQYMVKENEGHGFMNEENRFEFYEAMAKFFETHLK